MVILLEFRIFVWVTTYNMTQQTSVGDIDLIFAKDGRKLKLVRHYSINRVLEKHNKRVINVLEGIMKCCMMRVTHGNEDPPKQVVGGLNCFMGNLN